MTKADAVISRILGNETVRAALGHMFACSRQLLRSTGLAV